MSNKNNGTHDSVDSPLALGKSPARGPFGLLESLLSGGSGDWQLDLAAGTFACFGDACRIFGLQPGRPLPTGVLLAQVHEDDQKMLESSWQEACRTGVLDVRYRFVCNGKLRWLHQRGEILFDANGKARSAKGSVSDETGRKAQDQAPTTTSHAELRALSLHLERIREEERTRIAREIHDELGQTLSAVKMDLGWVRTHLRPEQEALHEKVQGIASKIEQTVETVRRIAYELRPPLLDTLGLAAAVMALAEDYQRQMGIRCNVKVPVNLPDLPTPHVSALFRITQELLTNVTRHARASRVDLSLIVEGAQLFLSVGDNGRGMRKQQRETPSLGLLGIRERVAAMGGTLEIVSTPKIAGTQVTICIPVTEKGREH